MPSDATTFVLAFGAVFAGLALYVAHLERAVRRLEARLAARPGPKRPDGPA